MDRVAVLSHPGKTLKAWVASYLREFGETSTSAAIIEARKAGYSERAIAREFGRKQIADVRRQLAGSDGDALLWPRR
jgi:hypothetical protein